MKKLFIIYAITCLLFPLAGSAQKSSKEYLQKVLANIENIKSASYLCRLESWEPGDTLPLSVYQRFGKEIFFPQDTTIGSAFTSNSAESPNQVDFAYDGKLRYSFFHENKVVIIDDFTYRPLPFRPISPPFFNFCKNIITYGLTSTDNIRFELKEEENHYFLRLTIDEEEQIEFFGKAYHMPKPPFYIDPLSIYEIWISKTDNLPYKVRREMSHSISVNECLQAEFNKLSIKDFNIIKYIPEDYEIRTVADNENKKKTKTPQYDLTGKPAPIWTLNDPDSHPVSLNDFSSQVLVICVTGIGCGACQAAVPFLKEFKSKFSDEKVGLVAIESWSRRESAIKNYANKKQLNYTILTGTQEFIQDYQTGSSAPWFFILDKQRVIRKVIQGYGGERTNKEILNAITSLL